MSDNQTPPPPNDKIPAARVVGRARPEPKRFSRRVILGATILATSGATAALVFGLLHHPQMQLPAQNNAEVNPQANPFNNFPSTYTPGPKPPALPPPPKAAPTTVAAPPLAPRENASPTQQATQESDAEKQAAAELAAAQASAVFFEHGQDQGAQQAISSAQQAARLGAQAAAANGPGAGAQGARQGGVYGGRSEVPADAQEGLQEQKNAFLSNSGNTGADYAKPIEAPLSPYELQAGDTIPAALVTRSNSDLPGDLVARVTEDVFDTVTGKYLLIPHGSRLYGRYDSLVSYGQTRSLIIWTRLLLPNGKYEDLGGMIGTDQMGQSGMTGDVNRHLWSLGAALAVATLLSVGPSFASSLQSQSGSNETLVYQEPLSQLGSQGNSVGQEFVSKELNRPNTITILSGQPLRVLVNKDMILEPYAP